MPKKLGVNSKAEEARTRKAQAEAEKKEKQAKDREEKYWQEAEGSKSKAAKKREEDEQKRAELAAKKAEVRRLAELEEREIEKALKKPDKKAARTAVPAVAKKRQSRVADEGEYERIVLVENLNRDEAVIEAHSVDEAIAKIKIGESLPVDKHPEKRLKASFKAFEEAELPRLKADKPGLTHTQYKDMIWKLWKKSPDNPLNKVAE
ncbi:hypothetical protein vseg_018549 [Gypsophila vaccaria]